MSLSQQLREQFDALLEEAIGQLPDDIHALLEEVPVIVDDEPSPALLRDMDMDDETDVMLCGLHWGVPITERSVDDTGMLPTNIYLFREPIMSLAAMTSHRRVASEDDLYEQIWITLLHEIGHHFGLDEARLEALGYG